MTNELGTKERRFIPILMLDDNGTTESIFLFPAEIAAKFLFRLSTRYREELVGVTNLLGNLFERLLEIGAAFKLK